MIFRWLTSSVLTNSRYFCFSWCSWYHSSRRLFLSSCLPLLKSFSNANGCCKEENKQTTYSETKQLFLYAAWWHLTAETQFNTACVTKINRLLQYYYPNHWVIVVLYSSHQPQVRVRVRVSSHKLQVRVTSHKPGVRVPSHKPQVRVMSHLFLTKRIFFYFLFNHIFCLWSTSEWIVYMYLVCVHVLSDTNVFSF